MAGRAYKDISGAHDAVAVTPSDSTVIPGTRGLYVGVSGDISVRMVSGNTALLKSVAVGILPVQVDKINSTNTTATDILALY